MLDVVSGGRVIGNDSGYDKMGMMLDSIRIIDCPDEESDSFIIDEIDEFLINELAPFYAQPCDPGAF